MIKNFIIVFVITTMFNTMDAMHELQLNIISIAKKYPQFDMQDINKRIGEETLLIAAVRKGDTEIVQQLVQLHRDINANVRSRSDSALSIAVDKHRNDIVEILLKHCDFDGEILDDAFTIASYGGNKETIEMLLAQNAHHKVEKDCLGTSLRAAAEAGYKEIVYSLLEAKIDANTECFLGQFALLVVEDSSIAKLLLDHGADVNIQNCAGTTPLKHATFRNDVKMAELFLTYGAQVSAQDDYGVTALEIAAWRGHTDLVTLFLASPKIEIEDINATLLTLKHHLMSHKCKMDQEWSRIPRREITEALMNKQNELSK